MAEKKEVAKRKKPKFLRTDWHKKIRLGRGVKKNQKWHGAKGRQNKFRLNRKGKAKPRVGWGSDKAIRNKVQGISAVRVENLKELDNVKSETGVVIGKVGAKKRAEIIKKAGEKKLKVLNRYKQESKTLGAAGSGQRVAGGKA